MEEMGLEGMRSRREQRLLNEISLIKSSHCRISKRVRIIENFLNAQFRKEFGIRTGSGLPKRPFCVETAEKLLGKVKHAESHDAEDDVDGDSSTEWMELETNADSDFGGDRTEEDMNNICDDKKDINTRTSYETNIKRRSLRTLTSSNTKFNTRKEGKTDAQDPISERDQDSENLDGGFDPDPDYKSSESDTDFDSKKSAKKKRSAQNRGSVKKSSLRCTLCSKVIEGDICLELLRDHIEEAHSSNRKKLNCEFCHASFPFQLTLNDHLKRREQEGGSCPTRPTKTSKVPLELLCCICGQVFRGLRAKQSYKDHLELHDTEIKYKCSICDKGFSQRRYFNSHNRQHAKVQPQTICPVCGKIFEGIFCSRNLKRHMDVHSDEKKYKCRYCGKAYKLQRPLQQHVSATHEKERHLNHSCQYCDKRFTTGQRMRLHERTHTGEQPYQCDVCGKGFAQKMNMLKHRASMHKEACDGPELNCPECDKVFLLPTLLNSHIKDAHGSHKTLEGTEDVVNCGKCSAVFLNARTLKIHDTKTHPSPATGKAPQNATSPMSQKLMEKSKRKSTRKTARTDVKMKPELIETEIITADLSDCASIVSDK